MAASAAPPRKKTSLSTVFLIAATVLILFDPGLRALTSNLVGFVLYPIAGFGGRYPVLTILITGSLMVLLTTLVRHFTTDWLEMAKTQATMKHFQKEFSQARKDNNTYKMKILQEKQPEIMQMQQAMSTRQLKTMPATMIVVIPIFFWLSTFLAALVYEAYTAPWNPSVEMFDRHVFPHWILLYMCLSIPLGALIQKTMKYLTWKSRWQDRHPDVHEV